MIGVVDGGVAGRVAGIGAAAARRRRRGLQDLQMVIGKVDPNTVRGLVAVEIVGAGRVRRQCMTRT